MRKTQLAKQGPTCCFTLQYIRGSLLAIWNVSLNCVYKDMVHEQPLPASAVIHFPSIIDTPDLSEHRGVQSSSQLHSMHTPMCEDEDTLIYD